ncbi:glycosyltransferase involved in cell wall biosynthesis [Pontibacter aydingkolensis]|uniref:Glycosyltransferase family 4 protein n=1 Tax=Pontibacter aydingkolensis TaxID=1911536 RepID=A0ABS7CUX8_9BACT|nr:glycosyltransferase family 4 protein [Pontibacter aydingkolensis]MBW7467664.1 glycosyltransferase family 4 protein [Pontibacter aydingkolensis]
MSKNIVFINQATGYLTIDIINEFTRSEEFEKVALIAGSIRVQNKELDKEVSWTKIITYNRSALWKKGLSWMLGTIQIWYLLLTRYRNYEVFYFSIPPTAYLLSYFFKQRFSILVYDIYPDALKTYGISESNMLYHLWVNWNKRILPKAYKVFTLSEGMADLLSNYLSRNTIKVIPNWSDVTLFTPIPKDQNPFIRDHGLEGKFLVQYSGNIGYTHNVEVLVELAKELKSHNDIIFQIIGRGERTAAIKELVEEYQLNNVRLLPFQADDILPYSLAAADLAVITLNDETALVSVPSKTYNLLAVGAPLLCISSANSELNRLVKIYQNGSSFESSSIKEMADFVLELMLNSNTLNHYKINSRKASENFTSKNAKVYLDTYVYNLV